MEFNGVLHFWSETGTEGGHWALQDEEFIQPATSDSSHEQWSYDGLHVLEDGDELDIYDKNNPAKVVWSGTIKLRPFDLFTESAHGLWIHADQEGIERDVWARWFIEGYPAKLKTLK